MPTITTVGWTKKHLGEIKHEGRHGSDDSISKTLLKASERT